MKKQAIFLISLCFQVLAIQSMDRPSKTYSDKASSNFLIIIQTACEQDILNSFNNRINPNTQEDDCGNSLLHFSACRKLSLVANMLIEAGAKTTLANDNNETPLDIMLKEMATNTMKDIATRATVKALLTAVSPQEEIKYTLMPLLTMRIMLAHQLERDIKDFDISDQEMQQEIIRNYNRATENSVRRLGCSSQQELIWVNGMQISRKALQG